MICEICDQLFTIDTKGSGGKNRLVCYNCCPKGLSKPKRQSLRLSLLASKASVYKLSRGCSRCGYNKCPTALEWHHICSDKEHNPSEAIQKGWLIYLNETSKCILLCSNCHRELHYGQEAEI